MPVTLPPKENNLFKRILKCYEQKQYKIGLKFAKQILTNPKFAEHGETLAMKGLILNCLGRKEEAYDYVRKGLRNDLKSHVCWHVYGLLQRSDKKYDEAIKCYRNALKWDKDNIQILRDLSLLQIQMRDLEGYKDTRYRLLQLRAGQRASWIGYAMSYHLLKDYDMAYTLLEEYRKTQQVTKPDAEHSELLLYQNLVLREAGKLEDSLNHLNTFENVICDKLTVKEVKASLFIQLGNYSGAETLYRELLKRNPENWSYYAGLERAMRAETSEDRLMIYKEFMEKFPRSSAPKRLPLNFTTGETFSELLEDYMKPALRKGVPPLFVNLRSLYKCKDKAKIIEEKILKFLKNLQEYGNLSGDEEEKDPPTVLLWTYYFLAQHYDYLRQTDKAMEYIDIALEHTPTLIEAYMVKARIYKHAGDFMNAAYWMDEARMLDTADRYVNSKCAKYQLRANQIEKAEETCALFTRDGVPSAENLNEMQCMWYQIECGLAYQRLGNLGEALKKGHELEKHFEEITEDQFDFHTYCMRKMTLTAYVRLLRLEDVLRSHKFYLKAAKLCIECYVQLYDKPLTDQDKGSDSQSQNMSAKELKKLRSKQRRAEKKAQLQQQDKVKNDTKESKESEKKTSETGKEGSLDADALARVSDPIEQALKFLVPLQSLLPQNLETHLLAFEIYIRKGKMLLMLQSIKRAHAVEPNNPRLHECIIRFMKKVSELDMNENSVVYQVIKRGLKPIVGDQDARQYNESFLNSNSKLFQHRIAGAKMMYYLEPGKVERALSVATDLPDDLIDRTIENCTNVLNTLLDGVFGECESTAQAFSEKCHQLFPLGMVFSKQDGPKVNGTTENNGAEIMCDGEEA